MGMPDVRSMLVNMTWPQFQGWMAYYEMEPFGEERGDTRMGISTSNIVNAVRASAGGKKFTKPDDFIPKYGPSAKKKTKATPLTTPEQWSSLKNLVIGVYGDRPPRPTKAPRTTPNLSAHRRRKLEAEGKLPIS